jgi:hypothetical protein
LGISASSSDTSYRSSNSVLALAVLALFHWFEELVGESSEFVSVEGEAGSTGAER